MVTDGDATFTFERPTNWQLTVPKQRDPLSGQPTLYLANFPLLPECAVATTPLPVPSAGQACAVPFAELPEGGIFIELFSSDVAGPIPAGGEAITVAGLPSKLELDTPGRCASHVVDEVLIAPIPFPPAGTQYFQSVVACLREPNIDANERAVRAFIASLKRR